MEKTEIWKIRRKAVRAYCALQSLIYDYERHDMEEHLDDITEMITNLGELINELELDHIERDETILEFAEWR